jgi:choline dehydrogenase-like flavoprotein
LIRQAIVIEDLRELATAKMLAVDLCVVGGGPAGVTIAKELLGSGLRVCLADGGGFEEEPETQALYQGESVGHPVTMDEGRYRVFGGSVIRWGGRNAMLDPIDFQTRDWVKHSGWPIDLSDLYPYYARAQETNSFPEPWLPTDEIPPSGKIKLPKFKSEDVDPFVWRYAPLGYRKYVNHGTKYRDKLKADPNTYVLLHANLTSFEGSADGSNIESITVTSLNGNSMTVKAKAFVLCCGGIENVRLVLNAPENIAKKVNEHDNLGRYFAQHPRGLIATLDTTPDTARLLQNMFSVFYRRSGIQYEVGFALSAAAQRKHGLVNASAAMYYEARPDSPWKSGARLRGAAKTKTPYKGMFRDVINAISDAPSVASNFGRRVFLGQPAVLPNPLVTIIVDLEQEPDPESRVMLSSEKDPLGMNRAKVDWRISEIERRTAHYFNGAIAGELNQLGLGETRASAWLNSNMPLRDDELYGTYHHIGATRMSKDPHDGVVNEDCRCHGVNNLYFAGCSVFPTGGHANPTLTIVALAVRLADHLRSRLAT